jgi:hypothetical protein
VKNQQNHRESSIHKGDEGDSHKQHLHEANIQARRSFLKKGVLGAVGLTGIGYLPLSSLNGTPEAATFPRHQESSIEERMFNIEQELESVSSKVNRWIDIVRDGGATGNNPRVDSYPKIQKVLDNLKFGDVVYFSKETFYTSKELTVKQHGVTIISDGTISPFAGYKGFLFRTLGAKTTRDAKTKNNVWLPKIDIKKIHIDGLNQSKGIYFDHSDHFNHENILIERTKGIALKATRLREGDFKNVTIAMADAGNQSIVELEHVFPKSSDPNNNIRFWGLSIVYCGGQNLKITGGTRNIFFYGSQIHYLDYETTWSKTSNNTKLIELLNCDRIYFLGGNLRLGLISKGTLVSIGDSAHQPRNINFVSSTLSGDGKGATAIEIVNGLNISIPNCPILFPNGTKIKDANKALGSIHYDPIVVKALNESVVGFHLKSEGKVNQSPVFRLESGAGEITDTFTDESGEVVNFDNNWSYRISHTNKAVFSPTGDGELSFGIDNYRAKSVGLKPLASEPKDKYVGMIVMANQTTWNPAQKRDIEPYLVVYRGPINGWQSF